MKLNFATKPYLAKLNLNYEERWRSVPRHLTVADAWIVRERFHPYGDGVPLNDWVVQYQDGTCDARSLYTWMRPVVGKYFERMTALASRPHDNPVYNYFMWDPEREGLEREITID